MPDRLILGDFVANKRVTVPGPAEKGQLGGHLFTHTVAATFVYNNVDKLVLGVLPAFCTITDAVLRSPSGATNVVSVGLMSGVHGDDVAARTVGTELYSAVAMSAAGVRSVNFAGMWGITPVDYDRSIGLIATAADIAAAATLALYVQFKAGPHAA